jgi:ATP-dependent Clp protease ATP-binding subunit ClpA
MVWLFLNLHSVQTAGSFLQGYNPSYGARPLRRAIMRLLEDSMAERMLSGEIKVCRCWTAPCNGSWIHAMLLEAPAVN